MYFAMRPIQRQAMGYTHSLIIPSKKTQNKTALQQSRQYDVPWKFSFV